MRATGRTATFAIASAKMGLRETSKRQGSGSNVYHVENAKKLIKNLGELGGSAVKSG
jgi:hypothetical protein